MSNRTLLASRLATALGSTKVDADAILVATSNAIQAHLAEHGEAVIPGFGRLKVVDRPSRQGRNPKTGESITVPAKQVVKFKAFPKGDAKAE